MTKTVFKSIVAATCIIALAGLLGGCKSTKNTDDADQTINQNSGEDIAVPPVPPEPTRSTQ